MRSSDALARTISPELILVSPAEEQRRAREQLHASPSHMQSSGASATATPARAVVTKAARRPRIKVRAIAAMAAVALAGAFASLVVAGAGPASSTTTTDIVIAAAGDICSTPTDCAPTAALIDALNPDAVLTLGDNAYPDGTLTQYQSYYGPNWGRHNAKVFPAPGNHEFHTANAQGYRDYFGSRAPGLWYSYDLGGWHLISLAGASVSAGAGSPQEQFLKQDLAAHASACTLVYFHEPRFSSGSVHGSDTSVAALWNDMYAAGVDLVLNGHEHSYERFAKQNAAGVADPNGVREIVAGIGGAGEGTYGFGTPIANSEVRAQVDGILKLTLRSGGYEWQVVPVAGQSFTDGGSDTCSGAAPASTTTAAGSTTTNSTTATTATTTTATSATTATTTAPSATTAITTTTTTAPSTHAPAQWRFAYSNQADQNLAPIYGYNLIDVATKDEADVTPAGTQGQVWLFDYDNNTCRWEKDDAYVTSIVTAAAGDPKVAGFYFSNEPDPFACPNAVQQHRDRNSLIHRLAPTKYTLIGIDANWREHFDNYGERWVGTADFINYNPYICYAGQSSCDFAWLDHVLHVAQSLNQPYFVALQAFADSEWRWPTAAEEAAMLDRLKDPALTGLRGYLTFSWNWSRDPLLNHPSVLAEIRAYNLGLPSPCCATAPTSTTTASTSTTTGGTTTTATGSTTTATTTATGSTTTTTATTTPTGGTPSTTPSTVSDTTAPTAPTNVRISSGTRTSLTLTWDASYDSVGVTAYRVRRGSTVLGTTLSRYWVDAGLKCARSYTYIVEAIDFARNVSAPGGASAVCSFH